MSELDFLRADAGWLVPVLVALACLVGAGAWGLARRRAERRRLVDASQLAAFLPGFSPGRAVARVVLASLSGALLALSLLGPVLGYTRRPVVLRGLDIVVCLDTSRSMLGRDLRPDRLTRAVREVNGLLARLRGDRVALVAFSGDVRDVAPLTHDTTALRGLLAHVTTEDNRLGGTDLGAALEHALALFDGRTGAHEAIVLLTDGEDLSGRGRELAKQAAERGIRVYVVGVGTRAGSKIPVRLPDGHEGFVTDPDGREVVSALADESLRELARSTGGEYLSTEESPTPLEELFDKRISRLDRRELEGGLLRVPHDRYQYTLALALACMVLEAALRERRTRPGKGGRA